MEPMNANRLRTRPARGRAKFYRFLPFFTELDRVCLLETENRTSGNTGSFACTHDSGCSGGRAHGGADDLYTAS